MRNEKRDITIRPPDIKRKKWCIMNNFMSISLTNFLENHDKGDRRNGKYE